MVDYVEMEENKKQHEQEQEQTLLSQSGSESGRWAHLRCSVRGRGRSPGGGRCRPLPANGPDTDCQDMSLIKQQVIDILNFRKN